MTVTSSHVNSPVYHAHTHTFTVYVKLYTLILMLYVHDFIPF